jgi:hypothetical protein
MPDTATIADAPASERPREFTEQPRMAVGPVWVGQNRPDAH